MLQHYILSAWRSILRKRFFSALNVMGFAVSVPVAVLIFLLVRHERSYDMHHSNFDRIVRINTVERNPNGQTEDSGTQHPLVRALKTDMPEMEAVATVVGRGGGLVTIPTQASGVSAADPRYREDKAIAFVTADYFRIFDYNWQAGSPATLFSGVNGVVLSERMAAKYFPRQQAMGQRVLLDNKLQATVVGIVANPPHTTDMPFEVFYNYAAYKDIVQFASNLESWNNISSNVQCYALVPTNADLDELNTRLKPFGKKYNEVRDGSETYYRAQPMAAVHFDTDKYNFNDRSTSQSTIVSMLIIGFFMLVIACVNYINLSTAMAMTRAREIGVRMVMGSNKHAIFWQYMVETAVITAIGMLISLGVVEVCLPVLSRVMDRVIEVHYLSDGQFWLMFGGIWLGMSLLAGFYPALVLSGYKPVEALRKLKTKVNKGGLTLRRGLVSTQFFVSQVLIIGAIITGTQLQYMRNADLGYDPTAVAMINLPVNDAAKVSALKARLQQIDGIEAASFCADSPTSGNTWSVNFYFDGSTKDADFNVNLKMADHDYQRVNGLALAVGRWYAESDTMREVVVNEAFVRKLGFKDNADVIGRMVQIGGRRVLRPIVGVVRDIHLHSMRNAIQPCIFTSRTIHYQLVALRLQTSKLTSALPQVQAAWTTVFPEYLYEQNFLSESVANFYSDETRMVSLFNVFTSVAIFICCIGLFGLVSYLTVQRTKEIGIRKVLGATAWQIIGLFVREFNVLLVGSFLVAVPAAYYVMNKWLQNFVFRIEIGASVFITAFAISFVIVGITIGWRAWRAAQTNPTTSLRSE